VKEDSGFAQKLISIDQVARLSAAHWDEIFPLHPPTGENNYARSKVMRPDLLYLLRCVLHRGMLGPETGNKAGQLVD
jgi:hypothetical protein